MALSEIGQLRHRVRQQFPNLQLMPDEQRSNLYCLVDRRTRAIEADGLTTDEINRWLAGITSLAQLRQEPAQR